MTIMPTTHSLKQFETLLLADLQLFDHLIVTLKAERQALKERDYSNLEAHISRKQSYLTSISQNANQRSKLFASLGLIPDATGFQQLLSFCDKAQKEHLESLWNALQSKLKESKHCNETNHRIISRTQLVVERFLRIYRGQPLTQKALYAKQGQTIHDATGRLIGTA
ncbi:flagellar protein FlgN [Zooshikella ganghwensis]|uniref:Flagellar protein FlgN n=2 Tax=Zooshikella ganghwensis TaxID=202772 RepID=A0A4P9VLG8_9GAMM|nr:flagellar protein FlgN [Zooshikella ganghwensis]